MNALDRVVDAAKARKSGSGYEAKCPVHDDRHASLSINEGDDGRVLVFCHVCGKDATPAIVEAWGLSMADLASGVHSNGQANRARRIVATYPYVDESGKLLYEVVRYHPKDFRQRRPDGTGGWFWKLGDVRRVLYNLPAIIKAPTHAVAYVAGGEKDVDALTAAGMLATCNSGGEGKWSLLSNDKALHGRPVVILPDNDAPGRKHAEDVAGRLHGHASAVRVLELPDLPEHGDVYDWLAAGNDPADLDALAVAAPEWQPRALTLQPQVQLDEIAARKLSRNIFDRQESFRAAGVELCRLLAQFADGGGFEAMGLVHCDRYGRTHRTLKWFAGPWGVEVRRIQQMIQRGRLLLEINEKSFVHLPSDFSEEQLAALLPLADRPKDLATAYQQAVEMAEEEAQTKGKSRSRVTAKIVRKAVRGLLGTQPEPKPTKALWKLVAAAYDAARDDPNVPADVVAHLRAAHTEAVARASEAPGAKPSKKAAAVAHRDAQITALARECVKIAGTRLLEMNVIKLRLKLDELLQSVTEETAA